MATVAAIASAFQTVIAASFTTTARVFAEQPELINVTDGKAVIFPINEDGAIAESFGGTEMSLWHIVVLACPAQDLKRGQVTINSWLSASGAASLKKVIEADQTMGGVIHTNNVTHWLDRGLIEIGGVSYWGAKLEVEVWAS